MAFVYRPPASIVSVERFFPPRARRLLLWLWWGSTAVLFVFAASTAPHMIGAAFIVASVAFALSLGILFLEHGLGESFRRISLHDAMLRARRGETVNLAYWCNPDVLAFIAVGDAPDTALQRFLAHECVQAIFARLAIPSLQVRERFRARSLEHRFPPSTHAADAEGGHDTAALIVALAEAAMHAARAGHRVVTVSDAFVALARASFVLRQLLFDRGLTTDDLDAVAHWEDRRLHERQMRRAFWTRENLLAVRPFGRSWAFGYTPTLDRFAIEVVGDEVSWRNDVRVLGRLREITALERALTKSASANAVLVAEPGVGAEDVIRGFVARVRGGSSLAALNYRRVVDVDFGGAIAGLPTQGEIEGRVRQMLAEAARAGGSILIVENFPALLAREGGGADLTAALLPFLQGARIQLIAMSTPQALHEVIEKRTALSGLFERIEVHEPDARTTLQILLDVVPAFEERFRIAAPYPALKTLVTYAERTIQDVPFPRKALDLFEESMIAAQNVKERVLTAARVAAVVSEHTEVPVGALSGAERERLLHLEEFIHERIVDQEEAVHVLAAALRRARSGITAGASTRPIGTFLFMGPTGVGKTETAKALAEAYYGSENRLIRLDMSEFQGGDAVARLIGAPATREEGRLTTAVREQPFALLLLDEFEKAHAKALDLFLQVFDEGRMKDGWGRVISFTNNLIIATSNAGAEFIRRYLKDERGPRDLAAALREEVLRRELFRPELLNRFDGVVVFRPLGAAEVRKIARRLLAGLSKNVEREHGVGLVVEDGAIERLAAKGFNQEFGARELRRVIQNSVENLLAERLIAGSLRRGDTFTVSAADVEDARGGA
ncbi:MAG: hypothetical protein A2682_02885 [Candidatus Terrybacteria bacterium RIFCSPHIGHO2_01_FULL_58_15]|uniref:Clp R domain-containing protein n=1 Tax=Terrybacteria sp. (strain RIFCSPHIGHO2_01_FULL_58_15) TaxID=1802363 RepID=A0A1G2PJ88_TERXR|nr:MAG: hypothetical protein A2682_02885 [Candidatus Terrybacteria bacterium RIFCSPHIGHO2_01_FULL_58_15]